GNQILFILRGHEAGGDLVKAPAGQHDQTSINHQRHGTLAQNASYARRILAPGPCESAVERAEKPAEQSLHEPGEPILWGIVLFEQYGGKGGRKGQRIEG